eukprot:1145625-Pelagomonas_calceolata.AAC.6
MGREPLWLTAPSKGHTRLPWDTQGILGSGILASLPNKIAWQPCSARGVWEAVAGAVNILNPYKLMHAKFW